VPKKWRTSQGRTTIGIQRRCPTTPRLEGKGEREGKKAEWAKKPPRPPRGEIVETGRQKMRSFSVVPLASVRGSRNQRFKLKRADFLRSLEKSPLLSKLATYFAGGEGGPTIGKSQLRGRRTCRRKTESRSSVASGTRSYFSDPQVVVRLSSAPSGGRFSVSSPRTPGKWG